MFAGESKTLSYTVEPTTAPIPETFRSKRLQHRSVPTSRYHDRNPCSTISNGAVSTRPRIRLVVAIADKCNNSSLPPRCLRNSDGESSQQDLIAKRQYRSYRILHNSSRRQHRHSNTGQRRRNGRRERRRKRARDGPRRNRQKGAHWCGSSGAPPAWTAGGRTTCPNRPTVRLSKHAPNKNEQKRGQHTTQKKYVRVTARTYATARKRENALREAHSKQRGLEPKSPSLHSTFRIGRTSTSPWVAQAFSLSGAFVARSARLAFLAQLPAATRNSSPNVSLFLVPDDSKKCIGVHLQLHGVETHLPGLCDPVNQGKEKGKEKGKERRKRKEGNER